jgi:adenosine deaminase
MAIDLQGLPKAELHCHLDGCVRVGTVAEFGKEVGLSLPDSLEPALVAPEHCHDLADYICRFELALRVMQRPGHLRRIARELVEDLAIDGVVYAEVRFAPQLHTREGLSLQEVLDAVAAGLAEGSAAHGVEVGLILCCLRHQAPEESLAVAELAAANRGVVRALDLAGDEARYGGAPHAPAFHLARESGLRRTVHAGEAAGAGSVREALDLLGAERIGHGVRVVEDPTLVDRLARDAMALEMCPRSNVQTRAVHSLADHPADRLLRQGLRVTVSTDARTVSATSLTAEFESLRVQFGWGQAEFLACQRNALEAAFAPAEVRDRLLARFGESPPSATTG